ncbi:MAG TPA: hypothetical protein VFG68_10520 [Fimbriiglobus sp.]|nr:hypothetical protein [Fimbriiglobus sp.]
MNIRKLLSQGLFGVALALAVGALLCASPGELRAAATGPACDCTQDSCRVVNGNLTGFCVCTANCGCGYYTDPNTGQTFPRCLEVIDPP